MSTDPTVHADKHPLLARIDVAELYPPFLARLLVVLDRCHARGAHYYATSGLRSFFEQELRYKAYQDKLAGRPHTGTGSKAAPPGLSAHNYGIAVDVVPDAHLEKPGLQADYSAKLYVVLGEEIKAVGGLVWGESFGDMPHVQLPGFVSGKQLEALREVYQAADGDEPERRAAVWAFLDSQIPSPSAAGGMPFPGPV